MRLSYGFESWACLALVRAIPKRSHSHQDRRWDYSEHAVQQLPAMAIMATMPAMPVIPAMPAAPEGPILNALFSRLKLNVDSHKFVWSRAAEEILTKGLFPLFYIFLFLMHFDAFDLFWKRRMLTNAKDSSFQNRKMFKILFCPICAKLAQFSPKLLSLKSVLWKNQ